MSSPSDRLEAPRVEEMDVKCPSCSASFRFNPETGNLKCPYCEFESDIPEPDSEEDRTAGELSFYLAEDRGSFDWGVEKKTVICQSCAAESIYDALQVADVCPYCGSNHLMEASAEGALSPNGVCSFEVTDQQAGEKFRKWIASRWFTPRAAKRSARPEAFSGVYLPYWTFDSKTASRYSARYGIDKVSTDSQGKRRVTTTWHQTSGFYQEFIDDQLVCATSRYDKSIMGKILPFNVLKNRSYRPEYLSGFLSERYSVGLEDGWKVAQRDIHSHLEEQIKSQIIRQHRANRVDHLKVSTSHSNITYKYLMLPVWLSSFKYRDKVYQFMVNGQTGKVGGKAPISPLRVTLAVISAIAVVAIIAIASGGEGV